MKEFLMERYRPPNHIPMPNWIGCWKTSAIQTLLYATNWSMLVLPYLLEGLITREQAQSLLQFSQETKPFSLEGPHKTKFYLPTLLSVAVCR